MRAANPAADNHLSKTPCPVQAQALPCSRHPALAKETPHAPSFQITGTASRNCTGNVTDAWMTSFSVKYRQSIRKTSLATLGFAYAQKSDGKWDRTIRGFLKDACADLGHAHIRACSLPRRAPQAHGTSKTKSGWHTVRLSMARHAAVSRTPSGPVARTPERHAQNERCAPDGDAVVTASGEVCGERDSWIGYRLQHR